MEGPHPAAEARARRAHRDEPRVAWTRSSTRARSRGVRSAFRLPIVAVIGSGSLEHTERAERLGAWLATQGVHLLTGAGQGVMAAVSRAFAKTEGRKGMVLGVLPSAVDRPDVPKHGYPNEWVEVPICTHLPLSGAHGEDLGSRNHLVVLSANVIVALPGGRGTASEARLALRYRRPIIAYLEGPDELPELPAGVRSEGDWPRIRAFVASVINPFSEDRLRRSGSHGPKNDDRTLARERRLSVSIRREREAPPSPARSPYHPPDAPAPIALLPPRRGFVPPTAGLLRRRPPSARPPVSCSFPRPFLRHRRPEHSTSCSSSRRGHRLSRPFPSLRADPFRRRRACAAIAHSRAASRRLPRRPELPRLGSRPPLPRGRRRTRGRRRLPTLRGR
jgi:uncharacterized protein (TIGR00725 family)